MSRQITQYEVDNPWLQRRGERDAEYAWFQRYLEHGMNRTYRRVADRCGIPIERVEKAAAKQEWALRAGIYDQQVRNAPLELMGDTEHALAMQYAMGYAMVNMGMTALQSKNTAKMKVADIRSMVKEGVEMMRRAHGVADLKIDHNHMDQVEDTVSKYFLSDENPSDNS